MKLLKTTALGAILGGLAMVSFSASAASVLSFDDNAQQQDGYIYYGGTGGSLGGVSIDFVSILGIDTPANNGNALDCIDCELNFTTGPNTGVEGPTQWTFFGGGSMSITGTAQTFGGEVIASGTLVSGQFTSAQVLGTDTTLIVSGIGVDTKHQGLVDWYGLGTLFEFAQTEISLGNVEYYPCNGIGPATPSECGGFTASVTNADFDNMAVPVPAAVWLFGSGLLGLVGIARRRRA